MEGSIKSGPALSFSYVRDSSSTTLLCLLLAGIAGLAIAIGALDPFGDLRLAIVAFAAAAFLIWSAIYTTRHHEWLIFALLMIEVLASASVFTDNATTIGRYGLEALFCLPWD